jgi:(1->4)-alpha-D-glucan 1-alpha-D-glucosylmutase
VEDTASYIYNRLVALNEVGGEPDRIGISVDQFHRANIERASHFPDSMLATGTHDTKRSEDVRARIAVISERPEMWRKSVKRWSILNRKHKVEVEGVSAPDNNEEYLLYQTLIGAWPLESLERPVRPEFVARIQKYMAKAIREAKINSNWIEPNQKWEEAVNHFVEAILTGETSRRFRETFRATAREFARSGALNSLSQQLLKLTAPGVPDIYQGTELWDFSLVDPDNRRPVDYRARHKLLSKIEESTSPSELLKNWRDGRIKMFLTTTTMRFRRANQRLFQLGRYEPVQTLGEHREQLIAFRRCLEDQQILVCVPRLTQKLGFPPLGGCWKDTAAVLSKPLKWRNIFTGQEIDEGTSLRAASLFRDLPFALLEAL